MPAWTENQTALMDSPDRIEMAFSGSTIQIMVRGRSAEGTIVEETMTMPFINAEWEVADARVD